MADAPGDKEKYVLFEFLDRTTVTFRRSDMEYPDIRRQFLDVLLYFLEVEMTEAELARTLVRVPEDWGDYLELRASRPTAALLKAEREPGANSGKNPVITSIVTTPVQ